MINKEVNLNKDVYAFFLNFKVLISLLSYTWQSGSIVEVNKVIYLTWNMKQMYV